jgi:inhibitor of KinA sporulation pathway (predicted exonuclease)
VPASPHRRCYGDYDRRQFETYCRDMGIAYPFGPSHLNVKALLAIALGSKRESGLSEGLRALGLSLESLALDSTKNRHIIVL